MTQLPPKPFFEAKDLAEIGHLHEQTVRYRHRTLVSLGEKLWPPMPDSWPLVPQDARRVLDYNDPALTINRKRRHKKL